MDTSRGGRRDNYVQLESNDAIVTRLAQQDKVPWYNKPNLRSLYLLMFPTCFAAEIVSGFDQGMVNALQAVPSWLEYYHYPRSALLGLVAAAFAIGAFVAAPFIPLVADRFGRRYAMAFGSAVSVIGGILQGSSVNVTMFIIARFISGVGVVFALVAALASVGELSHPKERAVMGSIMNALYYVGAIAAAAVAFGTYSIPNDWAWRIPSLLQIVPSLFQVSLVFLLPESPRWLISKGRRDEAYTILVTYHAEGDNDSEFVKVEYTQIEQTLAMELGSARSSEKAILSTSGMRKRVVIASFLGLYNQWSGTGLISHFLALILDSVGIHSNRTKNIVNLAKFSWGLVNGIFFALIASRYPRRRMFLTSSVLLFVFFLVWTVAGAIYSDTHSKIASHVIVALIFLHSPAYNLGATSSTYPFLIELFPYYVRASGLSIFQWWSRGAGFFNMFVNPIGLDALGWKWYIFYCVWVLFTAVFIYLEFPETYGRTPEELTFLFDDGYRLGGPGPSEVVASHEPTESETRDALEASVVETVIVQER